jgi:hypothetical protein
LARKKNPPAPRIVPLKPPTIVVFKVSRFLRGGGSVGVAAEANQVYQAGRFLFRSNVFPIGNDMFRFIFRRELPGATLVEREGGQELHRGWG